MKKFISTFLLLTSVSLLLGCSALSGPTLTAERYMACPQESVWNSTLETLEHYPVTVKDKAQGLIETDWQVQPVAGRTYGIFSREGLGDKERSRLTISLKSIQQGVVSLKLTERRHHWGFVGGQQLYKWYPVEPSQEALNHVLNQLTTRLDKEGCIVES